MNPPSAPMSSPDRAEGPAWRGAPEHQAAFLTSPALGVNGTQSAKESQPSGRPRTARSKRRPRMVWTLVGVGLALVVVALGWVASAGRIFGKAPFTGPTYSVVKDKLKVSIVERGTLESARNGDIICTVRSGTKGSTVATTIKWIIDPGVRVAKGDKLVELDSSGFVEQLKDQRIKVDQAKASWVTANEEYHIQESQNESDIEAAKNTLDLAEIDLEKYEKAEFEQALEDVNGRIEVAKADLEMAQARSVWATRMAAVGYQAKSQARAEQLKADSLVISLRKLETEKRVLVEYTKARTIRDLKAKLAEAKRGLVRVNSHARAKLIQADAERSSKESIYKQELSRMEEIEGEIAKCNVVAPQDGMVVYYVSDQARSGGGSQQSIVAQGEPVREGQKMLQIPDLTQMVVHVRVHEAMVSHLRDEKDPKDTTTWQLAQIQIDAIPNRVFHGHVKTVDTVASQQDWFSSDVKLYKTMVSIDEVVEGLRPGMSAEVTIFAQESSTEVMVVPVHAIVGAISLGATPRCYVVRPDGQTEPREIVVGMSNQQLVEVRSGLRLGEKVVLNPASLSLAGDEAASPDKAGKKAEDEARESKAGGDQSRQRKS
jgi:HlyD family secretion protein